MYPWYDAWWLEARARAMQIISSRRPGALDRFTAALSVFETRPDFRVRTLDAVFDEATLADVRATLKSFEPSKLEMHEARDFGRFVVHDHAPFTELQRSLVPLVSELAGEPVEPSYNFASMYGAPGVCAPHMDAPDAKWTLDVCIDQSAAWPIHFSRIVPWPDPGDWPIDKQAFEAAVKSDASLGFDPVSLEPGEAVLFSGCNQWHYRDRMPQSSGRQFCDLLFFHFIPAGSAPLLDPANWASIFGVPELAGLRARQTNFV